MLGIRNINERFVPISRFNKGEANKIFDEVSRDGLRIVMKNNQAKCIMLSPEAYDQMIDAIEDQYLLSLARERDTDNSHYSTMQEVADSLGITPEDLEAIPDVEIE